MEYLSTKKIIASFGFLSGATLITVIMGVVTNKVIALYAGTEGIGVIGLFRSFLGFIVPILTFGTTTVIVQMISTSSSESQLINIVKSVFNLFIVQVIVAILAMTFLSKYVVLWLFPKISIENYMVEVNIIFIMALAVVFSQLMIALINGKVNIKMVTKINIITACSTLILVYPLLSIGSVGFALIVGSGSVFGALFGFFYVRKVYKKELERFKFSFGSLKDISSLPISIWMLLHPLVVSATFLNIQALVNKNYGADSLGLYTAATMLETTTVMLLMAAMKTYYLPMLGKINNQKEKAEFINKVLSLLIVAVFPIIIFILFLAEYILWGLFSIEFIAGADILKIISMAMLAQVFSWCYAMYLLHKGDYKTYFLIDAVWAIFLSIGIWFVSTSGFPLIYIPIIYMVGGFLSLVMYSVVIVIKYDKNMLLARNIYLGFSSLIAILFIYNIGLMLSVYMQLLLAALMAFSFLVFVRINYIKVMN